MGGGNGAGWLFYPQRGNASFHRCAPQGRNRLSLCPLGDPHIMQSALELFSCLCSRNRAASSGLYPREAHRPLKLQSFSPLVAKFHKIQPHSFSQPMALEIVLLILIPVHSTLSWLSLQPGLLPVHSTHVPFLPQTWSLHFLPSSIVASSLPLVVQFILSVLRPI